MTNHWIVVTGFAKSKTGEKGPAELSGKIKAMDIVVGCNGVDLTELTFNECMSVIRHADWPKTLHFIRDPAGAANKPALKESWAKFGTQGVFRRRYLEVKEGELLHSKPTPGGAIASQPDGKIKLTGLEGNTLLKSLVKVEDKSCGAEERFQLRLVFTAEAKQEEVVIACEEASQLEEWAEALISASGGLVEAEVGGIQVLEVADLEATALASDDLWVFDEVSCSFKQQRCLLAGGDKCSLRLGGRGLRLPAGSASPVIGMRQLRAPNCKPEVLFQIVLDTQTGSLILGKLRSKPLPFVCF